MNTKDLMIGDWVCVRSNDKEDTYNFKIKSIISEGVYGPGFVGFDEDLEPIPLTAEILEKNGIKLFHTYTHPYRDGEWEEGELEEERKRYPMSVYETLNPYISLVIRPNEQELSVRSSDYKTIVEKKEKVIFVHELQHALKLCEIDKEIIL